MNAKQILRTSFFTPGPRGRWGLPLLLEGDPGTAKTSIVEQVTSSCGLLPETVIASLREPSDFLGLPMPAMDGGRVIRTDYAPPAWATRVAEAGHAVAI